MPEQVYGWTVKEIGLFLEGAARRRRRGLEEAITAGWTAEYCSRVDRMDPLPTLIETLLPEKAAAPAGDGGGGMSPDQQAAYLLTWARLLGAKFEERAPAGDPGRN
ncbi:MAG: hypothetical protein HUU06_03850 [Planctomycetaceae bacterium]|nr:hypothetical protein [Planctomycetaceae bacterium]